MIKILEGFPDNVIAASAVGRVTRQNYEEVLIPQVDAIAKKHPKIRCYYEIGADFGGMEPGAVWEDFRVGVEFWTRWERVAVVTDVTLDRARGKHAPLPIAGPDSYIPDWRVGNGARLGWGAVTGLSIRALSRAMCATPEAFRREQQG